MVVLALSGVLLAGLSLLARTVAGQSGHPGPRTQPFPSDYRSLVVYRPQVRTAGLSQKEFHRVQSCGLSFINGTWFHRIYTVQQGQTIGLGGILFDSAGKDVPADAWVIFAPENDGKAYQVPARFRLKRPIIQGMLGGDKAYAYAGFITDIDSRDLPAGSYHLYIVFKGDQVFYTCDSGRRISVVAQGRSNRPVAGRHPA